MCSCSSTHTVVHIHIVYTNQTRRISCLCCILGQRVFFLGQGVSVTCAIQQKKGLFESFQKWTKWLLPCKSGVWVQFYGSLPQKNRVKKCRLTSGIWSPSPSLMKNHHAAAPAIPACKDKGHLRPRKKKSHLGVDSHNDHSLPLPTWQQHPWPPQVLSPPTPNDWLVLHFNGDYHSLQLPPTATIVANIGKMISFCFGNGHKNDLMNPNIHLSPFDPK